MIPYGLHAIFFGRISVYVLANKYKDSLVTPC